MTKKYGKVYDTVTERLREEGLNPEGLEVATLGRGPDHLIIVAGATIGEYNHRSGKLTLYPTE